MIAYRNLLDACQEIADIGGGDFEVVGVGDGAWEFQWYEGQMGTDRSAEVTFALAWGNMERPRLVRARSNEVNAVYVGGAGEGALRQYTWRTDAVLIAESAYNRREMFVDARNLTTVAGLNAKGDWVLAEYRPRNEFTFRALQIPGCRYRKHYVLGDLVTVAFLDFSATEKIVGLEFTVDDRGEEIAVEMEIPV
jgi:hypothetical protein